MSFDHDSWLDLFTYTFEFITPRGNFDIECNHLFHSLGNIIYAKRTRASNLSPFCVLCFKYDKHHSTVYLLFGPGILLLYPMQKGMTSSKSDSLLNGYLQFQTGGNNLYLQYQVKTQPIFIYKFKHNKKLILIIINYGWMT